MVPNEGMHFATQQHFPNKHSNILANFGELEPQLQSVIEESGRAVNQVNGDSNIAACFSEEVAQTKHLQRNPTSFMEINHSTKNSQPDLLGLQYQGLSNFFNNDDGN